MNDNEELVGANDDLLRHWLWWSGGKLNAIVGG